MRRRTHQEYIDAIQEKYNGEYEILGEYTNKNTKISTKHLPCGTIYMATPNHLLRGHGCPCCARLKINQKEDIEKRFKQKVKHKTGDKFSVVGEYIDSKTPIKIYHTDCDSTYEYRPIDFLQDPRCNCQKKTKKFTTQLYKDWLKTNYPDYEIIEDFTSVDKNVTYKHNVCNNTFQKRPSNFKNQICPCPYCNKKRQRKSYRNELIEYLTKTYSYNEYTILTKNDFLATDYVQIKHNTCGHIYKIKAYLIKQGRQCPHCNTWCSPFTNMYVNKHLQIYNRLDKQYYLVIYNKHEIVMSVKQITNYLLANNITVDDLTPLQT